jgi:hypothetical protein
VLQANAFGPAAGRMDLETVVLHELGHLLGRPDVTNDADPADVMDATLPAGVRRLPEAAPRPELLLAAGSGPTAAPPPSTLVVNEGSPAPAPLGRASRPARGHNPALLPLLEPLLVTTASGDGPKPPLAVAASGPTAPPPPSTTAADTAFAGGTPAGLVDYPGATEWGGRSGPLPGFAPPLDAQKAADLGWDWPGEDAVTQPWRWPEARGNRRA